MQQQSKEFWEKQRQEEEKSGKQPVKPTVTDYKNIGQKSREVCNHLKVINFIVLGKTTTTRSRN